MIGDGKDPFDLAIIYTSKCLSRIAFLLLRLFRNGNSWNKFYELHLLQFKWNRNLPIAEQKSKVLPNLLSLFQLFHSLRWNRRDRWNTLPALPIPKNCCALFNISLFHLFLFLKKYQKECSPKATFRYFTYLKLIKVRLPKIGLYLHYSKPSYGQETDFYTCC